jgi:hypothetical protein
MAETLHERYDRDERRLVATASGELWTDALVDLIVDVASPILEGASWRGVPEDAPPRWSERSTAMLSLAAMALRGIRTVALTVRAGYAAEAQADLRRLHEAAGHARHVAMDASGQYAENWLHRHGKGRKPRAAFGSTPQDDTLWKLMSGQAHADFEAYANLSAMLDQDRRIIHRIGPRRDVLWDNVWLWLAARQFTTVLACVLMVHPHLDQANFLVAAERVVADEERLSVEMTAEIADQHEA